MIVVSNNQIVHMGGWDSDTSAFGWLSVYSFVSCTKLFFNKLLPLGYYKLCMKQMIFVFRFGSYPQVISLSRYNYSEIWNLLTPKAFQMRDIQPVVLSFCPTPHYSMLSSKQLQHLLFNYLHFYWRVLRVKTLICIWVTYNYTWQIIVVEFLT